MKNYMKFINAIRSDENLTLTEGYFLETLFNLYNTNLGYAFPSYEKLMKALKTKRRGKISNLIKSLVKKGYIKVGKLHNHNTYYILKYLFIENKNNSNDSNNGSNTELSQKPTEKEQLIMDLDNTITQRQAKSLLEMAKDDVNKVINYVKYSINRKVGSIYYYVRTLITRNAKINISNDGNNYSSKKECEFVTCCSSRNYTEDEFKMFEWQLLGWA